jgi:hypothetical protein
MGIGNPDSAALNIKKGEVSNVKVVSVKYEKLVNLGNYEHQSIGVEVALEDGEFPHDAVARAKKFVEAELKPRPTENEWASAKRILDDPDIYTGNAVKQARAIVALCETPEEIPF